jgi:hypothetical protein
VKHSIGDGATTDGSNGGVANLTDSTMHAVHEEQHGSSGATYNPLYAYGYGLTY